jgi:hypothetical protein
MGMMDKAKDMKDKAAQSGKADEAIDKAADVPMRRPKASTATRSTRAPTRPRSDAAAHEQ